MKTTKITKTLSLLLLSFSLVVLYSCSSDDDNNPNNTESPGSGAQHTYELTITGGELDGQVLSGVIDNKADDDASADDFIATTGFTNSDEGPNLRLINLFMEDDQVGITGWVMYNEETGISKDFGSGEVDALSVSSLTISVTPSSEFGEFLGGAYISNEGTVTLTNVKLLSFLSTAGTAAFQMNIEGTFIRPLANGSVDEMEEAHISGEIVFNVPVEMEWMEEL
ncbi:hypothetical protein [Mesonia sp.]|uniref:hypothetical protein n=1 Tax=Mesonia sp. TaxID=1960830 RepID=UPI003F9A3D79